jgi:hypothetical protein
MLRSLRIALVGIALCALTTLPYGTSYAGTIIKLSLGGDPAPDIIFDGLMLSTAIDGNGLTAGDQDTDVEFLDFLSGETDIIAPPPASFSMSGLATAGPATVIAGVLLIQDFIGGTFNLYDDTNGLLLSGMLDDSTLAGPIGPPATGALFTTSFSMVTGGSLAPQIDKDSLTLSMSLTDINVGGGFSVSGAAAPMLDPFTADSSVNIAGEVPEPATAMLLLGVALAGVCVTRQRR